MYGLKYKHIRIEDQQLDLKMHIIENLILIKRDNIEVILVLLKLPFQDGKPPENQKLEYIYYG